MATGLDTWEDPPPPRRYGWLWIALAIGLVAGISVGWYFWRRHHAFDAVVVSAGRLTLDPDKGDMRVIERNAGVEAWYRVTLDDVPAGECVPLTCLWIDPAGRIYHRNQYETQPVTHPGWLTHARCKIGADAKVGAWRVEMRIQRRTLHELVFEVR